FLTDGTPDTTFGGGAVQVGVLASALAQQPDGKILVAGDYNPRRFLEAFSVARLNSDGTTDTNFGVNGIVRTNIHRQPSHVEAVIVQPEGKILVGGSVGVTDHGTNQDTHKFALVRYESTGALDTSFGGLGRVVTDFGDVKPIVHQIMVIPIGETERVLAV